ncbi:MAG: Ig-like domain-containing protein, partial [Bacteroidota bacterium]|nr:Ig-like domain-containing protein [Bacteroidota bacterium]
MKYRIILSAIVSISVYSCANQLPPSGGEDDRIPPRILSVSPKPNSLNFRDKKITFRFDEYVDRRSFQESFFISPKPGGEINFDWSGREVEVEFSQSLDRNKTYVIVIGNELKDVRGSNRIESPVSFAFSTGAKIDKGIISGNVLAGNYDRVKILAYIKNGKPNDRLNPENSLSDYVKQVSPDGSYQLTNLPEGEFRIFAITDEDRNNLYDKDLDKIAILSKDYRLTGDSNEIAEVNLLLKEIEPDKFSRDFVAMLKPDSISFISANISNDEKNIPPEYRFYFYFRNNSLSKQDIVNNFSLRDSANNVSYRTVFNWLNDSLVEVFTTEKLNASSAFEISIDLTGTGRNYFYKIKFYTAGKNSFGKLSGKITRAGSGSSPVYVQLY